MGTVFNSSPKVHGVFSGSSCKITIARKTGTTTLSAGFLISSFRLSFGRTIGTQHHINIDGVTYMAGDAEGTLSLTGMVGDGEAFKEILGVDTATSMVNDVCTPLTVTITPNAYTSCSSANKPAKFICSGCVVENINLDANSGQGMTTCSASISLKFTGLELQ